MKFNLPEDQKIKVKTFAKKEERFLITKGECEKPFFSLLLSSTLETIDSLSDDWELRFVAEGKTILMNLSEKKIRVIAETVVTWGHNGRYSRTDVFDKTFDISDLEAKPLHQSLSPDRHFSWLAPRIALLTNAK